MDTHATCPKRQVYSGLIQGEASVLCREVNEVLDRIGDISTLCDVEYFDLKIILSELLQNAVRHGNNMDKDKVVMLEVCINENNCVEITVQDQGTGFDFEMELENGRNRCFAACDPLDMDEFGRGLLIVKNLCDNLSQSDIGNCITVQKRLIAN